jgi:hypothetical protein
MGRVGESCTTSSAALLPHPSRKYTHTPPARARAGHGDAARPQRLASSRSIPPSVPRPIFMTRKPTQIV